MVSISKIGEKANDRVLELSGLSTDVKPVGEVDDAENQGWLEL